MNSSDMRTIAEESIEEAGSLRQAGKLDEAIALYQRVITANPTAWRAYHFLGETRVQNQQLEQAIDCYRQALTLNPAHVWSYHCLGQALLWQGNLQEAIANGEQAVKLQPQQAEFQAQLGLYWELKGDFSQAIAFYQRAIALNPSLPPSTYSSLNKLMLEQDRIDELLQYCATVLKSHPGCAELYFNQGKAFAAKHWWTEAVASYTQAITIQPHHWDAYQQLATAYSALDRQAEAKGAARRAEAEFYRVHDFSPTDIPPDFDWQIYLALNPDLKISCKLQAIAHLLLYGLAENKLYSLKHLHDPHKRPDIAPQSVIQPAAKAIAPEPTQPQKLAVLVHIYYFELWSELRSYIQNIPSEFDLFVNLVASIWQPQMHDRIRQDFPQAKILISPNRGKDLGGHLALMAHLDFSQYNLLCLLHTKISPHIDRRIADVWRRDLLDAILGSKEKARHNLAIMNQYPQFGLMGSRYWRSTRMGNNLANYNRLLAELAIAPEAQNCEYLSGTMMLIRPPIMAQIYNHFRDVKLENGDERELSFHIDGQVAHAIERLIGNLVRDRGLEFFWQE